MKMTFFPLAAALLLPLLAHAQGFGGYAPDYESISSVGSVLFDALAPDEVKADYEFASANQLRDMSQAYFRAFASESLSELATLRETAIAYVQNEHATGVVTPLGEWLDLHLADFTVASVLDRQAKAKPATPAKPATTPGTTPARPAPAPSPTPTAPAESGSLQATRLYKQQYGGKPLSARAQQWSSKVRDVFLKEGVPPELIWQAEVESSWKPDARSPVGAAGLFQFMKPTAQELGLSVDNPDQRLDALLNAAAAARYLKRLHARFSDWPLALAAYNCGPGRVGKLLKALPAGTPPSFDAIYARLPAETKLYVPKIDALVQLRTSASLATLPPPTSPR
ncbi:MAG: lytic transglycosylase domain-containing protein [Kiritimatiellae bacterium]|nr:lytic transglycosylase domain-containing protein [Kiritimatiellia bacterium]